MQVAVETVKRGDELQLIVNGKQQPPEFVRRVTVVLHMSNGVDVALEAGETVEKIN